MDVVRMPQLGETVTEGTITAWTAAVGDRIEVDDALFEVSTEKVDTEVPSATAGHLRAILVPEGETVRIGVPVAVLTDTADEPLDLDAIPGGAAAGHLPAAESTTGATTDHTTSPGARSSVPATSSPPRPGRGRADGGGFLSPAVRRLLSEHGLTVDDVTGSGRDGRITRADVLAAAARADEPPAAARPASSPAAASAAPIEIGDRDEVVDLSRARLATAEHMARSLTTAAHALVAVEVDWTNVDRHRAGQGLSYLPFVARAVVDAIAEFPHLNASLDGDRLIVHRDVHLGIAVDVEQEALVVPVVRGADGLRLRALSAAVADLADRARRRRLPGDAFSGGTFTLTNVGAYGTFVTAPIINQPQVAILSTDGVRMAPVAVRTDDGTGGPGDRTWGVAVHPIGNLCLSFDHKAFDGAYAAAFLARVREILQTRDWHQELER